MLKLPITDWTQAIGNVVCCDCLDLMKIIPDKAIDLVLTDPPYFLPAKHYETRKLFARNFSDLGILEGFFKSIFNGIDKKTKNDGLLYFFCDGQSYPLFYYYMFFITKSCRPLIWDKKISFNGYYWRHQHELILFGVRPEKHKIPTGKGDILRCSAVKVDERNHPAEKPVSLLKEILENTSQKNDLIFDPFAGSFTTALAAEQLGRRWIACDISPAYCAIGEKRINSFRAQGRFDFKK